MKLRNLAVVAVAAGSMCVYALAGAEPMPGGWHHGGGDMELLHGLTLTDAQREQVKSIEKADRAQMHTVMKQMRELHEQIETGLLSGATSDQLTSLVQQEETLRNQMDEAHLGVALQIRGVLTPDQLAQASTQHAKLAALHEQEDALMRGTEGPAQ